MKNAINRTAGCAVALLGVAAFATIVTTRAVAQEQGDATASSRVTAGASAPADPPPSMTDPAAVRKYFETHPHEVVEGSRASLQALAAQTESAATSVTFNGFTSVQVNINAAGNNVVGDAANEPSLAVDPTDPTRIVIGWRQFDTITSNFRQAGNAYSHDGGLTWTNPGVLDPGQFRSDPVLAADGFGNFHYSSLSAVDSAQVFTSTDGGVTWGAPVEAFGGDKQWFVADERIAGTGSGHLYQDWNVQFSCCTPNDFTRSTDGGATFAGLTAITPPSLKWGTLDVGPDGTLYLAGAELNSAAGHLFTRSLDALNPLASPTFDTPKSISLGGITTFGAGFSSPNPAGLLGQTWIAAHPTNLGEIYILGSVDPPGSDPVDVMFIRSVNDGATWSAPVRVNDDPVGSNNWQWFGTMAVAPNGRIDVIWNDNRISGQVNVSALFYSFSTDAGTTWSPNMQVSPSFNSHLGFPSQDKIGDYYGMISDNGGASIAYTATFNGEEDVYFLRINRDCNGNGIDDDCDVACGPAGSRCDVPGCGSAADCNGNNIPDTCEPLDDCNTNGVLDICEIAGDPTLDCNSNSLIDTCENPTDCNNNGDLDICELAAGTASDCNSNGTLDICDVAADPGLDSNGDSIPDECEGACCSCATACLLVPPAQCTGVTKEFSGVGTVCGGPGSCVAPPIGGNDSCQDATTLPSDEVVSVPFDNRCATLDGPGSVSCPSSQPFGTDLWYRYFPPRNGTLVVSTCTDTNFDGILAVHSIGTSTCTCPTSTASMLVCGDDTCGQGGGPAVVTLPVSQGDCYLIRVGGWNSSIGTGTLDLSFTNAPPPIAPTPSTDGAHLAKNRFISFVVPSLPPNETFAIRVRLDSLHHPVFPPDAPDFSALEGQSRYVHLLQDANGDPVTTCVDSAAFGTTYRCATLGCTPQYLNWSDLFASDVLHVTGSAIVPSSNYGVSLIPSECVGIETACSTASIELNVTTARWGDVDAGNLDVLDITQEVDAVKQAPGSLIEPRSLIREMNLTPQSSATNVLDVTLAVDALKGLPYPFTIDACP